MPRGNQINRSDANAIEHLTGITGEQVRQGIMTLEARLRVMEQADFPLKHHFAEHSYSREIFIRAGSLLVGKIHKHSHINNITMGDCTVITEFGSMHIKAPNTFVSLPGTKRALYAHRDTIWVTTHVTDKTDIAEIEEEIIAKDYAEYDELAFQRQLSIVMDAVSKSGDATTTKVERD